MRRRFQSMAVVVLVAAMAGSVRAESPPEPEYAGKPASWWVQELVAGDVPDAATAILRRFGDAAAPQIAAGIETTRSTQGRIRLLGLLEGMNSVSPELAASVRPCLNSGSRAEQCAALAVVEKARATSLAAEVAALLSSADASVRYRATRALGALGDAAVPHVAALEAQIGDGDGGKDLEPVVALGRIGPAALPALPRLLRLAASRAPDPTIVTALVSIAPDDPRVSDEIVRAALSADKRTREWVLSFLHEGRRTGAAVTLAAGTLATNGDPPLRNAAAAALGHAGRAKPPVPEALFTLLGDDDPLVVGTAARSLETLAATDHSIHPRVTAAFRVTRHPLAFKSLMAALLPESGPAILEASTSDDTERRKTAWDVLMRTDPDRFVLDPAQVSRMLFADRADLSHRLRFLGLLISSQRLSADAKDDLCATLAAEGERVLAVRALRSLRVSDVRRPAILSAAARREPEVRAAALRMLSALLAGSEDARAAVVGALEDSDAGVRAAALQAAATRSHESAPLGPRDGEGRIVSGPWTADTPARTALVARLPKLLAAGVDARVVLSIVSEIPDEARPLPVLIGLLSYETTARQAVEMLTSAPADPSALLRPILDGDATVVAARAARVWLARRLDDDVVSRVAPWIESKDPALAREALLAVAALPPETLLRLGGVLIRAARAGTAGVAWPACHALHRISDRAPEAREALLAVADDPDNTAQFAVIGFLAEFGAPGVTRLVAFLDHPAWDARRNACIAVADAARRDRAIVTAAVPALERIAAGDDLELAKLARAALDAIGR